MKALLARCLIGLFATSLLVPTYTWPQATDPAVETKAGIIFSEAMSPYCPGRLLRDCPSTAAAELKDEIRSKVAAGQTADEIMTELAGRFGDEIRATPVLAGFGWFAWLMPIAFVILGAMIAGRWLLFRRSAEGAAAEGPVEELDPQLAGRIEKEMRED